MEYVSTRGGAPARDTEAVLRGVAGDGGLFVLPEARFAGFDWRGCLALSPLEQAERILTHLLPGFRDMGGLVRVAYAGKFETEALTPLVPVGDRYVLELFRGPTAAFKDVALSLLPRLITEARRQTGAVGETVILTATSGDTGKAALEGFRDVPGTRILVFYPEGGVSPIQRAQMVTQPGGNVRVCGVRGDFDDCQRGVKAAFAALNAGDALRARGLTLTSANSINIGRLAPQVVYYFTAYGQLAASGAIRPGDPVDFAVPTGNFGDILAGYYAKLLGLPVGRLICASNANRVLADFLRTGVYDRRRALLRTSSPSMDILVSSNLERLLYLASDGDTARVADCMARLARDGVYAPGEAVMARIRATFSAAWADEAATAATIGRVWQETGYLCDPHTAVAFAAAEAHDRGVPLVILATASPYKFPEAVLRALGESPTGDAFRQMEALRAHTGVAIPGCLAALEGAPVLHTDGIGREDILPYVCRQLGLGEVSPCA